MMMKRFFKVFAIAFVISGFTAIDAHATRYQQKSNDEYLIIEPSSQSEDYYRRTYARYEEMVIDNFNSYYLLKDCGNYSAIAQMKSLIKRQQREMRDLRNEAARNGVYINPSPYETKSL